MLVVGSLGAIGCGPGPDPNVGGGGAGGGQGGRGGTGAGTTTETGGGDTGGSGGGTGGAGGGQAVWTAPDCTTVTGTSAVTFTDDEGNTLAPTAAPLTGVAYTFGLAALDIPNVLLAEHNGTLIRSDDAGCTWISVAPLAGSLFRLTPAKGGLAYAFQENGAGFYRIEAGTPIAVSTPAQNIVGLGVDPDDGKHLRIGDASGAVSDSTDGGETWSKQGISPPAGSGLGYRFAFDPGDLDHMLFGQSTAGLAVSFNGGQTWDSSTGLGANANAFSVIVSPANKDLVWAESLEIGPDARHIYRSEDGGKTFTSVVDDTAETKLINGTLLFPHPTSPDVLYFVFGTNFQGYGTDIYRYDHTTHLVTKTHNPHDEVSAIVASPADPGILYFGLVSEDIN